MIRISLSQFQRIAQWSYGIWKHLLLSTVLAQSENTRGQFLLSLKEKIIYLVVEWKELFESGISKMLYKRKMFQKNAVLEHGQTVINKN